jgi:translation elongation factor EF-1beta
VNGTIDVAAGETKTMKTNMLFGLGAIQVTVMVGDETKIVEGTQVLILSILKR